jgi:hypothetical protein
MIGFTSYLDNSKKKGSDLATVSDEALAEELKTREEVKNIFPLEVFHDSIKPFITALNKNYDIPRSYIGLGLLCCYSTAIGTSFAVSPNGHTKIPLPVWGALVGISSSGKTLAIDLTHDPLYKIQAEFDRDYKENIAPLPEEARRRAKIKTVVYRDAVIATLVRSIMPDNPKGLTKYADELIEWINGMNQMSKKEGTDEQFWISSWNCKNYSGIRSGKEKFNVPRPFVNVVGGIQPTILHKLFAKDRDTTGFIFRLLFAVPEVIKIAEPESGFAIPKEYLELHEKTVRKLYFDLNIEDSYEEQRRCILTQEASKMYEAWVKEKIRKINKMEYLRDKEIHSGILGKIKEYAYRFAGILHIVDKASHEDDSRIYGWFNNDESIPSEVMARALKLADYFYQSAADVYETVENNIIAPPDVVLAASMFRLRASATDVGYALYGKRNDASKQRAWRNIQKWMRQYPRLFGANVK